MKHTHTKGNAVKKIHLLAVATLLVTLSACTEVSSVVNGEVLLDSNKIERSIEEEAGQQLGASVTVECPDPMSAAVGETRQCTIEDEYGSTALVDVTVQNREGYVTWETR